MVYIIGFIALWFHLNHGFWSMFQSIGWNGQTWLPRLKKIACWWTSIVVALFIAQAIVFTVQAHKQTYITNENLKAQYTEAWQHEAQEAKSQEEMQQLQEQYFKFLEKYDPQAFEQIQAQMQMYQQYQQPQN